jgi:5-deoxy-glucuronate isomerase
MTTEETLNDGVTIHPEKLPTSIPLDDLLIRPEDGITAEAEPADAGWRYLSFRSLGLSAAETVSIAHPDQEAMLVVIGGGGVRITFEGHAAIELEGRTDVFSGLPWAAYLPAGCEARVEGVPFEAGGRTVIAYGQAPASGRTGVSVVPVRITPDDVEIEIRGAGHVTRQVNNIALGDFAADRILCCEVFTPAANWSGWPAHKHDIDDMPREAVLEETYLYQMRRPEGWGLARVYFQDGRADHTWAVGNGDVLLVNEGYHPFSATQGYDAYYLNFLAGDRRTMASSDDPDTTWVRETWPSLERDPRLPLVGR